MSRPRSVEPHTSFGKKRALLVVGILLTIQSAAQVAWRFSDSGTGFRGSESYSDIASRLLANGYFDTTFRPPLYPLYLAAMMHIFGSGWEIAAVCGQALLSVLLGLLIFRFTAQLSSEPNTSSPSGSVGAGALAVVLYATNILFQFETQAKRETTLFTLAILLFFHAALFCEQLSRRYIVMAAATSIAFLLRPNAIVMFPVAAMLVMLDRRRGDFSFRLLIGPILLSAIILLPWLLFVFRHSGTFPLTTSTNSGQTLWKGNNDYLLDVWPKADVDILEPEMMRGIQGVDITTAAGDAMLKAQAIDYIKHNPGKVLRTDVLKGFLFFSPIPIPMGDGDFVIENGQARVEPFRYRNRAILLIATMHGTLLLIGFAGFLASGIFRRSSSRIPNGDGSIDTAAPIFRAAVGAALFTLLLLAVHCLTYPESRYRWPLDIVWSVLAAHFFWNRFAARGTSPRDSA